MTTPQTPEARAREMRDMLIVLRQHLGLFCTPDDAIAKEIFDKADALIALTSAEAEVDETTIERVARALDAMDDGFGYSLRLTRLVDGEETHTLTYKDGSEPIDFSDRDEAYAHIQHRRSLDRARAYLSALAPVGAKAADCGDLARQVISYDTLLRRYDGPLSALCAGDVAEIDAAYDDLIASAYALAALPPRPSDDVVPMPPEMARAARQAVFDGAEHVEELAPSDEAAKLREALEWFGGQHTLSLDFYSPVYGDDDDQSREWRVTKASGSINDREWTVVGRGETPIEAIVSARAALADGEKSNG